MADIAPSLVPSTRPTLRAQIKLAAILSLSQTDFSKLIDDVEKSPLFKKLFEFSRDTKAIHRNKFTRGSLSQQFYELEDNLTAKAGTADVEKILQSKKTLVHVIKKIGRENFEKYFLYSNGDFSLDEISNNCKCTQKEIEEVNQLLTTVFVESEAFQSSNYISPQQIYYAKVAQILPNTGENFLIAFHSPRMAQGLYHVDHEKIKDLKKKGVFNKDEKKALRVLLDKINFINVRKNSLYQLIVLLSEFQKDFLNHEELERIKTLTQNKMAQELKLSPSSVSRLLSNRSIETPNGKEYPLDFFFCSRKRWLKIRAAKIFDEFPYLTDIQIGAIIKKKFGIVLSRRSINQYRSEISNGK